jgi:hypothetical protein
MNTKLVFNTARFDDIHKIVQSVQSLLSFHCAFYIAELRVIWQEGMPRESETQCDNLKRHVIL